MAETQKTNFIANERLDLPDFMRTQDFVEDDLQQRNMHLWGGGTLPWVVKGFEVTKSGVTATVHIANSALFNLTDTSDLKGTLYIGDPVVDDVTVTLSGPRTGTLVNYIYVKINRVTTSTYLDTTAVRTFWDPTLNSGLGGEYTKAVATAEFKDVTVHVTTGAPSSDASYILIASATVLNNSSITKLIDERNLFYRLGKNSQFAGASITTPTFGPGPIPPNLNDLSKSGVFTDVADATFVVTIDSIGATDKFKWTKNGGAPSAAVNCNTSLVTLSDGIQVRFGAVTGHAVSDTWTFYGLSGSGKSYDYLLGQDDESPANDVIATGTGVWTEGDKEIDNLKEFMDVVMTQIKWIKFGKGIPNKYWYQEAPTNLSSFGLGLSGGGTIGWTAGAVGSLTFDDDFVILLPGKAYTNIIAVASSPISVPIYNATPVTGGEYVVWVDLNLMNQATLLPNVTVSGLYEAETNRVIIARRVGNAIYVGLNG